MAQSTVHEVTLGMAQATPHEMTQGMAQATLCKMALEMAQVSAHEMALLTRPSMQLGIRLRMTTPTSSAMWTGGGNVS